MTNIKCVARLNSHDEAAVRVIMDNAFGGDFAQEDWDHASGGVHVVGRVGDVIVGHAAVVGREIHCAGQAYPTGYVEAVGVAPDAQGRGVGTAVMRRIGEIIESQYQLGCLGTGEHHFYERLGWERWQGRSFVRSRNGPVRTPEDDDGIMVLRFGHSSGLDLAADISCDQRSGDVW